MARKELDKHGYELHGLKDAVSTSKRCGTYPGDHVQFFCTTNGKEIWALYSTQNSWYSYPHYYVLEIGGFGGRMRYTSRCWPKMQDLADLAAEAIEKWKKEQEENPDEHKIEYLMTINAGEDDEHISRK